MTIPEVDDGPLLVHRRGRVVELTLHDPPMNPVGRATVEAFEDLLPRIDADDEVRVVVVQGAGDHFCAGANIKEFGEIKEEGSDRFMQRRVELIGAVEALRTPVIAKMRGNALGGGLELAMGCHLRIADTSAKLGVPEVLLGILPGWGGTQRLPRLIPRDVALKMLMTGDPLRADEAHRVGLVTEVVEPAELDRYVIDLADRLAGGPRLAIAGALEAVYRGGPLSLEQGLDVELDIIREAREHPDHREGVRAFRDRRPPEFD